MENKSEVAKLREQIDLEREAFRSAMQGLMQVGGHAQVHSRYRVLDDHYEKLAALIGDREACAIFTDEYARAIEQDQKQGLRFRFTYRHISIDRQTEGGSRNPHV